MSDPACSDESPPESPIRTLESAWFAVTGAVILATCVIGAIYVWIAYAGRLRRRMTVGQFGEAVKGTTSHGQDSEQRTLAYPHMLGLPGRAQSGDER